MKDTLFLLVVNLLALFLGIAAFYLLLNNKEGWGWFLFGSLATVQFPRFKK